MRAICGLQEGEVRSQWVGRTVISSAGQLAYGHAQAVIDGQARPEAPAQLHGGHTWEQVCCLCSLRLRLQLQTLQICWRPAAAAKSTACHFCTSQNLHSRRSNVQLSCRLR